MGWLQTIRRSLFSLGGSTYDAVQAKNKRQSPTGISRSEDSELPPTERATVHVMEGSRAAATTPRNTSNGTKNP